MLKGERAFLLIAFIMAASWVGPVPETEATKTAAPDGPYPVGVKIERMDYHGRELLLMVWYPAQAQPAALPYEYQTRIQGSAVLDAPAEKKGAPYPLLIFSHGLGACGCQSVYYTENLASFGYVVAAPDHDDSMMCHIEGEPDISAWQTAWAFIKSFGKLSKTVSSLFGEHLSKIKHDFTYRSAEARAVIDRVLEWNDDSASFLSGLIDPDRIGVTGHSLGGFTTLMVGGVPFHCGEEEPAPEACDLENVDLRQGINFCCLEKYREMDPFELRDGRVKAILPLGPAMFFPDLERGGADLRIPVMIITGDSKNMEVPWDRIWTFYTNAPPPKYVIRLKQTDHMTISDSSLNVIAARLFLPGFRSHFEAKAQAYKDYSVAFFDLYLKGDDSRAALLREEPSNRFVELWSEAPGGDPASK